MIFSAIAVAWLAYLVPHFVKRRGEEPADEIDPAHRFSDSLRVIRRGTAPLLDQDLAEMKSYEVSTPMTRRAAIHDLRRLDGLAAKRRRRVLVALMMVLTAVVCTCLAGLTPWWTVALPGGLVLAFLLVARLSVRAMRRDLDARYRTIRQGSDEATVLISRKPGAKDDATGDSTPTSAVPGKLWDPVPITLPTYVSKPLAPRTVRTIDLSGPTVTPSPRPAIPVTADAQQAPARELLVAAPVEDESRQAASA